MKKLLLGLVVGLLVGLTVTAIADIVLIRPADAPLSGIKMVSPNGVIWEVHVENSGAILSDSIGCY